MAIYTTYDNNGNAEDFQDKIYLISPADNPVAAMSENIQAEGRVHSWQEDELVAIKKNAHVEGSAAGTDTSAPTVTKQANTQIFKETAEISRTAERVRKYGRTSEMARELTKRQLDMIRDEESAIASDAGGTGRQAGNVGAVGTPRELTSIYSQVDAGNVIDATAATTTEMVEDFLLDAIQAQFNEGGQADYIVTDSATAGYFPSFALSAGRKREVEASTLFNRVDIYVSQWGTLDVVISRSMTQAANQTMLVMDFEYSATPILDSTHDYALAKDGDRDRREIVRESTYAVLNSKAHAIVDNVPQGLSPA